mgnify:FL=1
MTITDAELDEIERRANVVVATHFRGNEDNYVSAMIDYGDIIPPSTAIRLVAEIRRLRGLKCPKN